MRKTIALLLGIFIGIFFALLFLSGHKSRPATASPEKTEQENAAVSAALAKQNPNTVATFQSNS